MQKLTVREAAENLGISEDAVRKRIQRGTVAHRKSSDDHVYVYMDNHAGAQQETIVEEIGAPNQDKRSSWWDYAAGASALLIITSGLIYVLGLFTLWIPITMTNTDYLTAWYAASLAPKTVVAGLGVEQLVAFPLLAGTLLFIIPLSLHKLGGPESGLVVAMLGLYLLVGGFSVWRIAAGSSFSLSQAGFPAIVVLVIFFMSSYLMLSAVVLWSVLNFMSRTWDANLLGFYVALVVIAFVSYFYLRDITSEEGIDTVIDVAIIIGAGTIVWWGAALGVRVSTELFSASWLSWGGLQAYSIVLATAFVAAFMLTIPSRPPLPSVEIDVKGKDTEAVNGKLLSHADAFWHVLQQEKGRVTAVPDDEVRRVWVSKAQ